MVSGFIWIGKNPRISKDFLQQPRAGLDLGLNKKFGSAKLQRLLQKIAFWIQSPDMDWCELGGHVIIPPCPGLI